ncbi:alpha/beta hydrolase [Salmonella enterica subsp. enterica]|nr:alpha/beta hydrolase [Salmonella enterica subsp. enterica]
MDKHSTWLAYLWAVIAGYFTHLSLNDWGALVTIVLAIATFFVNRRYKQQSAQVQKDQVAAMERRNQILVQLASQVRNDPDSTLKMLANVSEEGGGGA